MSQFRERCLRSQLHLSRSWLFSLTSESFVWFVYFHFRVNTVSVCELSVFTRQREWIGSNQEDVNEYHSVYYDTHIPCTLYRLRAYAYEWINLNRRFSIWHAVTVRTTITTPCNIWFDRNHIDPRHMTLWLRCALWMNSKRSISFVE